MKRFYIFILGILTMGIPMAFGSDYVPQVREGVEWGYSSSSVVPGGNITFFRLQFDGETEINGKVYSNLYMYDTYFLFAAGQSPVAWMREEDKRVYAILNPEYKDLAAESGCMIYEGEEEVLLMDYGISENESFIIGTDNYGNKATCTKIEPVQVGNSTRNRFTLQVSLNGREDYQTIEVVEGVGTLSEKFPGDGSIVFPFCEPLTGIGYPQPYYGWLYEREVLPVDT